MCIAVSGFELLPCLSFAAVSDSREFSVVLGVGWLVAAVATEATAKRRRRLQQAKQRSLKQCKVCCFLLPFFIFDLPSNMVL
jgi:hypothetical protein